MKTFQEKMDEVKVNSYKDCVWYLRDIDKCKMCDAHAINFDCHCRDKVDDFCEWITRFIKTSPMDGSVPEENSEVAEKYLSLDRTEEEQDSLLQRVMDALQYLQ